MSVDKRTLNQILINVAEQFKGDDDSDTLQEVRDCHVLVNQEDNHNKFYAAITAKSKLGKNKYLGFYGRNGTTMTGRTFGNESELSKIVNEKLRKGYSVDFDGEKYFENGIKEKVKLDPIAGAMGYVDQLLKEMSDVL